MIPLHWMAILSGVALAIWILGPLYAVLAPTRGPDPQRGQAIGCLYIFMVPGIVLAALLTIGVVWDVPGIIRTIYYIIVVPMILILLNAVGYGIKTLLARRGNR